MSYTVFFTRRAQKDKTLLKGAKLEEKAKALLDILTENPYQDPPPFERLVGDLTGLCSRRINLQHRLVYSVHEKEKEVIVYSMGTPYQRIRRK